MRLIKIAFLLLILPVSAWANEAVTVMRQLFSQAKVLPFDAMEQVEKRYGGHLTEFSGEVEKGRLIYEISTVIPSEKRELELVMSASTGEIWLDEEESFSARKQKSKKYQLLLHGKNTLISAAREAVKMVGGEVLEAELEQEGDMVFFEIELLGKSGVQKVVVDIRSGKPIPVAR